MSKWEDSFKKNTVLNNEKNSCVCNSDQGLFVPNRQLSSVVAGFLFLFFALFLVGYFLGKRSSVQQFTEKMHQEAFADQVYASVITTSVEMNHEDKETVVAGNAVESQGLSSEMIVKTDSINMNIDESAIQSSDTQYYAQLIGFGTEKAATQFVQKLASKGIQTVVKKHTSKTAKGRTSHWYQVVTLPYNSRSELELLVNRVSKEEMLKGARISVC